MTKSMRSFGWVLVLAVLAFAGRPLYLCTMEQVVEAKAEMPCAHAACEHCPAPQEAEHNSGSDCMLEASNPTAPAVEKVEVTPAVPRLIADLSIVHVLSATGPAPSLPPDSAFESPPVSITILLI